VRVAAPAFVTVPGLDSGAEEGNDDDEDEEEETGAKTH
jgi:hypothetical protein